LLEINIKKFGNPKTCFYLGKKPYIMILLAQYLLVGVVIGFLLEHTIRWTGNSVSFGERLWMITLWPIMIVVFVVYFIKGLNED